MNCSSTRSRCMTTLSTPCRASTISIRSRRSITRLKALSPWTSTKWTLRWKTDDRGAFSRPFPARPRLHPGGTGDRYGRKPDAAERGVVAIELVAIRQFNAGEEIGGVIGEEVGVDRGEHRVRVAIGESNVTGHDLDHMRPTTISAGLCRRTQIAPTNLDLRHVKLIFDMCAALEYHQLLSNAHVRQ